MPTGRRRQSALEVVSQALGAARDYYGIKKAQQGIELTNRLQDPTSDVSRASQSQLLDIISQFEKHGVASNEQSGNMRQNVPNISAAEMALPGQQTQAQMLMNKLRTQTGREFARSQAQTTAFNSLLDKVSQDEPARKLTTNYAILDRTLKLMTDAESVTPEQFFEFQAAVRGVLGVGQGGTGRERAEQTINSFELNKKRWKQFLTDTPQGIAPDNELINHFKDLALLEQQSLRSTFGKRLAAITAGRGNIFRGRDDLRNDFVDFARAQLDQFSSSIPQEKLKTLRVVPGGATSKTQTRQRYIEQTMQDGAIIRFKWDDKLQKYVPTEKIGDAK